MISGRKTIDDVGVEGAQLAHAARAASASRRNSKKRGSRPCGPGAERARLEEGRLAHEREPHGPVRYPLAWLSASATRTPPRASSAMRDARLVAALEPVGGWVDLRAAGGPAAGDPAPEGATAITGGLRRATTSSPRCARRPARAPSSPSSTRRRAPAELRRARRAARRAGRGARRDRRGGRAERRGRGGVRRGAADDLGRGRLRRAAPRCCPPATPSGTSSPLRGTAARARRARGPARGRRGAWADDGGAGGLPRRVRARARATLRPGVSLVQADPGAERAARRALDERARSTCARGSPRSRRSREGRVPRQRPAAQRRGRRRRRPRPPARRPTTASTSRSCSSASRTCRTGATSRSSTCTSPRWPSAREQRFDVAVATWWETTFSLFLVPAERYAYFVQSLEDRFYQPDEAEAPSRGSRSTCRVAFITEARWIADTLRELRPDAPGAPRAQRDRQGRLRLARRAVEPNVDGAAADPRRGLRRRSGSRASTRRSPRPG